MAEDILTNAPDFIWIVTYNGKNKYVLNFDCQFDLKPFPPINTCKFDTEDQIKWISNYTTASIETKYFLINSYLFISFSEKTTMLFAFQCF